MKWTVHRKLAAKALVASISATGCSIIIDHPVATFVAGAMVGGAVYMALICWSWKI